MSCFAILPDEKNACIVKVEGKSNKDDSFTKINALIKEKLQETRAQITNTESQLTALTSRCLYRISKKHLLFFTTILVGAMVTATSLFHKKNGEIQMWIGAGIVLTSITFPFIKYRSQHIIEKHQCELRIFKKNRKYLRKIHILSHSLNEFKQKWANFVKNPSEQQVTSLINDLDVLTEFAKKTQKAKDLSNQERLFLMDDICKKLVKGKIVSEWETLKRSPKIWMNPNAKPWSRLELENSSFQAYISFFHNRKKNPSFKIVDEICNHFTKTVKDTLNK